MTKRTLEDAFKAGYMAGFSSSGEGWNGEYGVHSGEVYSALEADRDTAWGKYKKERKHETAALTAI